MHPYLMIALAAASNLVTVYYLKDAAGMTKPWPTLIVVVSILLTQWLVSIAMQSGMDMALAVTGVIITVMVGSSVMGILLFHETMNTMQLAGLLLAIVGVSMLSLAKGA